MIKFRFQDLKIWQLSIEIAHELFDIADELEMKKLYRFAEQLRASGLSMSNNISEGSGSTYKKEFTQFLNYTRRSIFENANVIIVLEQRNFIETDRKNRILDKLDKLSRQITNFMRTL